jgi:inorganic triphosphatase YgiF
MAQETELKLSLVAQHLPRLLAHPLLAAQAPRREHLRNTYFDTAALALMGQRMAVRERQVDERTLLTVKTAGRSLAGLSQRSEWEAPTEPGRFDFATLVDDPSLAAQLTALAGQLVPVFQTDFMRCSWWLTHGGAQVEVALDQGFISAGAAREPLLELELELKSGPESALTDLARVLSQVPPGHGNASPWLHPSDRSKAERGLALFLRQSGSALEKR